MIALQPDSVTPSVCLPASLVELIVSPCLGFAGPDRFPLHATGQIAN